MATIAQICLNALPRRSGTCVAHYLGMLVVQLLVAFSVAVTLTLLLFRRGSHHRPERSAQTSALGALAIIFLIIFAVIWAGGTWMPSFGPQFYGVSWLGFIVIGLATALVVATAARPMGEIPSITAKKTERGLRTVGWFFWLLMLALIALGAVFYYQSSAIAPVVSSPTGSQHHV